MYDYQGHDGDVREVRDGELLDRLLGDTPHGARGTNIGMGSSCRYEPTVKCPDSKYGLDGYPLAMVYAPVQEWTQLYCESEGLKRGTIFKQLDLPLEVTRKDGKGGFCQ